VSAKTLNDWLEQIENNHSIFPKRTLKKINDINLRINKLKLADQVIMIGGTNGKGSTSEYLQNLLLKKNKKVGLYTSPHLFNFTERIRINGNPINQKDVIKSFQAVQDNFENESISYFDFITLAAFHHFSSLKLNFLILEVGLGGRLDPVNIVEPDISILTNIELDHTKILGSSRLEIAKEKSAILRKDNISMLGEVDINQKILKVLKSVNTNLKEAGKDFYIKDNKTDGTWDFVLHSKKKKKEITGIKYNNLLPENASCALAAYSYLGFDIDQSLTEVIDKTFLIGRRELIQNKILLDVCHNPSSSASLADYIQSNIPSGTKVHAILGLMEDKDIKGIVEPLRHLIYSWHALTLPSSRAINDREIKQRLKENHLNNISYGGNIEKVILEKLHNNLDTDIILIFGSFLIISESHIALKNILKNKIE